MNSKSTQKLVNKKIIGNINIKPDVKVSYSF